jgi:hypothetical protein
MWRVLGAPAVRGLVRAARVRQASSMKPLAACTQSFKAKVGGRPGHLGWGNSTLS